MIICTNQGATVFQSRVSSKRDWYARAGEFGCQSPNRRSYEEVVYHGDAPPYGVRALVPGLPFRRCDSLVELQGYLQTVPVGTYVVNPGHPFRYMTLQGEIIRDPEWRLWCSRDNTETQREALRHTPEWFEGLMARALLRHHMWPSSYADFEVLLERYPDSVIEFTCYRVAVGDWPNRNTIIWEVRNY